MVNLDTAFAKVFGEYVVVNEVVPSDLKVRISDLDKKIQMHEKALARMQPFEDKDSLQTTLLGLRKELRFLKIMAKGYTETLSLDAFTLRRKDGLPIFMILDVGSNDREFSITVRSDGSYSFQPVLDTPITSKMMDVVRLLYSRVNGIFARIRGYNVVWITGKLNSIVPPESRQLIEKAKGMRLGDDQKMFDRIFIVAEAPEWQIGMDRIAVGDPIVVGWNRYCERMFLITTYDPTDLETYLREQFSHSNT